MTLRAAAVASIAIALIVAACGGSNTGTPVAATPTATWLTTSKPSTD